MAKKSKKTDKLLNDAEERARQQSYVNVALLEEKMLPYRFKYSRVAKAAGIDRTTFRRKLRGEVPFHAQEIARLQIVLRLTDEQVYEIFIAGYLKNFTQSREEIPYENE